jgi:hypothetical protein
VLDERRLRVALALVACLGGAACGSSPTHTVSEACPPPAYVPAPSGPLPCPTAAEIEEIRADVPIAFEVDPTAGTFVCTAAAGSADLTRLQERTFQALLLMRRLEFDAPLPWTAQELYPWFVHAVRGVRFRATNLSFCCDPAGVIVIAVHPERNESWGDGFPTLIEGLVHEARHAEGGHPHTCGYDDRTLEELGAWGVQFWLNVWMGLHSTGGVLRPPERAYCLNRAAWLASGDFCLDCPAVPVAAAARRDPGRVSARPDDSGRPTRTRPALAQS